MIFYGLDSIKSNSMTNLSRNEQPILFTGKVYYPFYLYASLVHKDENMSQNAITVSTVHLGMLYIAGRAQNAHYSCALPGKSCHKQHCIQAAYRQACLQTCSY